MVLHRNPDAEGYTVSGTIIDISFDEGRRAWWLNSPLASYLPEHERQAWENWCNRNITSQRFERLREAREYLQAVMAVDPPPPVCISIQSQRRRLRRQTDGSYRIEGLPGLTVVAKRGYWTVYGPRGEFLEQPTTLAMLCDRLHFLDQEHSRR